MRRAGEMGRLVVAAVLGALVVSVLPAVGAVLDQAPGDPLSLADVNRIDERTDLKGAAKGANLQIKNTGNSGALTAKAGKNVLKAKATDGPVAVNAKASRNAVKIKVDPGQSPIKVNGSAGTAINLSADLLDGKDSSEFLGVGDTAADSELLDGNDSSAFLMATDVEAAHAGGDQVETVTATDVVVRSVSLTAPTAGVVIVNSTATAFESAPGDLVWCSITTGTTVDGEFLQEWESAGVDGSSAQLAGTRGFDVLAGPFTANLVCRNFGSGGSSSIGDSALTAIFIPTG